MIVGNAACRDHPRTALAGAGFQCAEIEDPYAAMVEVCRRPLVYRALIISLNSFFLEELGLITSIKRRFPHIEIWLTDLEGRQAALAEALRLGADGLVSDGGLHRIATGPRLELVGPQPPGAAPLATPVTDAAGRQMALQQQESNGVERPGDEALDGVIGEPVLTADELRALLQDQESDAGD